MLNDDYDTLKMVCGLYGACVATGFAVGYTIGFFKKYGFDEAETLAKWVKCLPQAGIGAGAGAGAATIGLLIFAGYAFFSTRRASNTPRLLANRDPEGDPKALKETAFSSLTDSDSDPETAATRP